MSKSTTDIIKIMRIIKKDFESTLILSVLPCNKYVKMLNTELIPGF